MTLIHYVVDPFSVHGREVIAFTKAFIRFAYDVFKNYRLQLLDHLIVTDRYGAANPERYTKDPKVLKLIELLKERSGTCETSSSGLYSVLDYAIVLCLKLDTPLDKALSLSTAAHEFTHFMTEPYRDRVVEGFVRALASDISEFKEIVDIVVACYDKTQELLELSSEARKRLAEVVPELKSLEDTCVIGFRRFRDATWKFASELVAEYIALNYFVFLNRLPMLRIGSILTLPYVFRHYVQYMIDRYIEEIAKIAKSSAYAYYRLQYPEKPAVEAEERARKYNTMVDLFLEKLIVGDHPKLKGFMHEILLLMIKSGAVLPADLAPKYPELYSDVMPVVRSMRRAV